MAFDAASDRVSRRLYIGNIPQNSTEEKLLAFLNSTMELAGVNKDNNPSPCVAAYLNADKRFAFVEFATQEDATACMQHCDGIVCDGHPLRIRRPSGFQ